MIDRLYGHFTISLKNHWPKKKPVVINPLVHKIRIVGEDPDLDLNELSASAVYRSHSVLSNSSRSSITSSRRTAAVDGSKKSESRLEAEEPEDMKRTCFLEMNRIKIEFIWKGSKPHFRSLKVVMVIALV